MTSPNKPYSKPSRVAKMSVKPIWRKILNPCNTSNDLNVSLPTPMSNPLIHQHDQTGREQSIIFGVWQHAFVFAFNDSTVSMILARMYM